MNHKPVLSSFTPVSTVFPRYFTSQDILVKSTVHPALHSFTTDIREWDANPGMTWPSLAFIGSCGSWSSHL